MDATAVSNPYIRHPKDHRATEKLWERFQGNELRGDALVDPYARTLVADWQRCRAFGVSPNLKEAPVLSKDDYRGLAERKSFLLGAARRTLESVRHLLEGVPGILLFSDEEGTILHVVGDPRVRECAADSVRLVEGGMWSETVAGVNGIGSAIARKAPVHVFASEHYCEGWHAWTCAAAPVLSPFRAKVLGVVDFSALRSEFRASSLALSHSLATNISAAIRVELEIERVYLRDRFSLMSARFPSDDMAVYDRLGLLVCHTTGLTPPSQLTVGEHTPVVGFGIREVHPLKSPESDEPTGSLVLLTSATGRLSRSQHGMASSAQEPSVVTFGDFVTANGEVVRMMERLQKIAPTGLSVLLIGETGTGKELIANYIHSQSEQHAGPFVAVNCGAISKELFESRFFGYERGGFTGADPRGRKGLFECADEGTLFLDEIGELPLDMQAGLLRVLETGKFRRIGSDREFSTNCRVIAATNRSLLAEVEKGTFRSDLFYRLSVVKASIPPLRDRPEDIQVLVDHFTSGFCQRQGLSKPRFAREALQALQGHRWPGNGRELKNVLEATVVCADDPVERDDLPADLVRPRTQDRRASQQTTSDGGRDSADGPCDPNLRLRDQERQLVVSALKKYRKMTLAARSLGISRSTLYRRLEEFGIDPRDLTEP